jgi:hypothetical protein
MHRAAVILDAMVLSDCRDLIPYALRFGHNSGAAIGSADEVRDFAEFTSGHRPPIFVDASTVNIQCAVRSSREGESQWNVESGPCV